MTKLELAKKYGKLMVRCGALNSAEYWTSIGYRSYTKDELAVRVTALEIRVESK